MRLWPTVLAQHVFSAANSALFVQKKLGFSVRVSCRSGVSAISSEDVIDFPFSLLSADSG